MSPLTLPGTIPGLLRRGSPVVSTVTDDAWPHGEPGVGIMPYEGQCGLVHNVSASVQFCAVVLDGRPGGLVQMSLAWVALDLSDPTGRAHAAWWLWRQDLDTVESAIATVFGPNIDYAAWLDEVASGADDSDDDIARLRLVCLHVAGVVA